MTDLSKITQADLDKKIADLVQRAESHLDHVGNSSKSDCLVYELLNQLKATNHALVFMTGCHKEWSDLEIKHKGRITELEAENTRLTTELAKLKGQKIASLDINAVIRDVAELPDRDSPADWPKAMLVTGNELEEILLRHSKLEPIDEWSLKMEKIESYLSSFPVDSEGGHCD